MINTALLPADKDPMGAAIADYFKRHKADRLRVFSSQFDEDEIPVEELFRTEKQMPLLERTALQMATGKILDVGAGSGCHSLTLQEAGKEVHAIDISPLSVEVMKQRGVRSVSQTNLFNEQFADEYDTILMLMNGSGIIGKLENLPDFFRKMKLLLRPGGCVLMDSSNLSYLFEEEDGSIVINLAGDYYGEVDFQMQYKNVKGDSFDWLYIDFQTLSIYAAENGFKAELVKEGQTIPTSIKVKCPLKVRQKLLGGTSFFISCLFLLFRKHSVNLLHQRSKFFRVIQTCQLHNTPFLINQDIACDTCLAERILRKYIRSRVQTQRIGHSG